MTNNFHRLLATMALVCTLPAQWRQASPTTSPGALTSVAMAGDLIGNLVMFGGSTGSFPNPFGTGTWLYSAGDWTLLPATGPSGRSDAQLVYDSTRSVWVLYGGWTSAFTIGSGNNETWEFDGATWTQATPTQSPGGFWKHGMCFDSARNVTVLFGGSVNGLPGATNGTFEYDGGTWQQITTTGNPGWRENPAMCFDAALGRSVLFGGYNALINNVTNQTWLFDGSDWTPAPVVGTQPPARTAAAMVFDPLRGVCIMSGGTDINGTPLHDTWEFDGVTWTQDPTTGPGNREFGFAFDPVNRQAVRYGGVAHSTETWTYGASSRTFGTGCTGSAGTVSLQPQNAPRLGQTYQQVLSNLNPTIGVAVGVLGLTETAPTPLGIIGMTGCTGHISPDLFQTLARIGGSAALHVIVPPTLSLVGISLFAQGLGLDPNFNPASLVSSNATEGVIGH